MTKAERTECESATPAIRDETALDGLVAPSTVFVIEDDPDVSLVLTDLLAYFGFRTCAARDGLQALSLWRAGLRPDVVLLDLVMPNMDGYRFRRAQQDEPAFARIPTIVITAQASPDLRTLDVQRCLRKPFDMDVLVAEIERQARRSRAHDPRRRDASAPHVWQCATRPMRPNPADS